MELQAINISKKFNNKTIIENFNISIKINDYICVIGKSGCGKTTILNMLSGMLQPDTGNIMINEKDMFKLNESNRTKLRNSQIGYLNCGNCLLENLTVYENILYPLLLSDKDNKKDIDNILDKLDILNIKKSYPNQISTGEYKRVCFARILALDTPFLILDEPTSNLDEKSANMIIEIINEIKPNKGIIIATHDSRLIKNKIINFENIKI